MSPEATQIIQYTGFGILIIAGASAIWFNWKLGVPNARKNLIDTYERQYQLDRNTIADKNKTIDELQGAVKQKIEEAATYKGQVEARDKQINDLTVLITGRDPTTKQFQEEGLKAIKRAEETYKILERIEQSLNNIRQSRSIKTRKKA